MIKSLTINNFKLYQTDVFVPLSNINLLTGINGKGKSTILQAFLLLSQSVINNRATNKIILNGPNIKLGSLDDVKNREFLFSEQIKFKFNYDDFDIQYSLFKSKSDATDLDIVDIEVNGQLHDRKFKFTIEKTNDEIYKIDLTNPSHSIDETLITTTLFDLFISDSALVKHDTWKECQLVKDKLNIINVHYVSADRMGPKNYYENQTLGHFITIGALGENTVNILYQKGTDPINSKLFQDYCRIFEVASEDTSITVEDHVNFWLDKIFQGTKVQVVNIKGEDLLKLLISPDGKGVYFKPTNVGYGFSYSLPIIVAGLIAKPGEILIIENPEAHLHPYAQSILAKFLSLVSATGVQVLIESHSEHILNGLRISVKDKLIKNEQLNVLYFDRFEEKLFDKIIVDEDGGISNWPPNFFDQASNDLNHLLGL